MKLILHIGAHKTGTTAIQDFLVDSADELKNHNWELIKLKDANLGDTISFWDCGGSAQYDFYEDKYKILIDKLTRTESNKIISSEDMFFFSNQDTVEKFCKDIMKVFDEIEVVVYLRNQVELAISNKSQGAKTSQSALLFGNDYENPLPALNDDIYNYFDYYNKLRMWETQLKGATFKVRKYSKESLINNDSVHDFVSLTGLPLKPKSIKSNKSYGSITTNILHGFRKYGVTPDHVWFLFSNGYFHNLRGGIVQLPSKEEAEMFFKVFSESNKKLEEKYGIKFTFNTKNYPEERRVQHVTVEDVYKSVSPVLNKLMLNELVIKNEKRTVELFRDSALLLQEIDPVKSYRLMEIANILRPEGPLIRKKLKELKSKL